MERIGAEVEQKRTQVQTEVSTGEGWSEDQNPYTVMKSAVTKQLSDAWLSTAAHSDIAAVPPTGTSFLHVKRARGRRNEEERRRVERFTVAYLVR